MMPVEQVTPVQRNFDRIALFFLLSSISFADIARAQDTQDKAQEIERHASSARQALDDKHPDAAIAEYQAILQLDPNNAEARGNLGVIAFVQGNCAVASEQFRQALALQPNIWKAQAMLGVCEKYAGHLKEARALLEGSFSHLVEPRLKIRAGLVLAELDYQQGQLEGALPVLQALQQADPANLDVLYALYRIHSDLADQSRDNIGLLAPDSARMHQIIAQHLINEGDAKRAVEQYREALRIDSHLPTAHFELGEAILQDSSIDQETAREEAKKEFEIALRQNPQDQKAECRLAAIYFLQNDIQAALAHYTRAAELDAADPDAQVGLAKVLVGMNQPENALQHLRRAVQSDPMNAVAHYRLSRLYRQLGRDQEADEEAAIYKKLRDAKEHLRSAYTDAYKPRSKQDVLEPDSPKE